MAPKRTLPLVLTALLAVLALLIGGPTYAAPTDPVKPVTGAVTKAVERGWASLTEATIRPGVQMYTKGAQCTANFVFKDRTGGVYVGYAAHCAGRGGSADTNGCATRSVPLGTTVTFRRGGNPATEGTRVGVGRLAYSSWITMRRRGGAGANACAFNDLALVKVRARDRRKVNPTVPVFGGPTGLNTTGTATGDRVYTYGNSSLRAGVFALAPHVGVITGDLYGDGGWSHSLYSVSPGVPGDSGSGFLDADGKAVGTLSTLGLLPTPLSNSIGDLHHELRYAQQHSGLRGLRLVKGTQPFRGL